MEERDHLTLRELIHVLWGRRILVLGAVALLLLASAVVSLARDTVYEAEAIVTIEPDGELSSGQDAEAFVNEVFNNVDDADLRMEAMQQSGWRGEAESFEDQRTIKSFARQDGKESGLLIRFKASTAEGSVRAANTYSELFVERVSQLSDRLAGGSLAATANVQSRAETPTQRSSPRPFLYAVLAAGAGVLIGGAAALAIESRTQMWRGARDAELTLRAPVLGVIPEYASDEGGRD
ncbi:hypothetical protein BH23ACT11_BH23ACT11_16380 [soil metagenome]